MFVGGVKASSGSPFILEIFPVNLESACVRNVGESVWRRVGAIGCGETGYGGW